MPRVLMVSPHFPPDASAGAHRVRLLAPHLSKYGWEPVVVSVEPGSYEGRLDLELAEMVPASLRVVRCKAWPAQLTRRAGIGDLGIRAFRGLLRACSDLLRAEPFDALFITIYPSYTALLGPILKRNFKVPFVLDYQDPWVSSWGKTVGGGTNGSPDLKSRISRALATKLEPHAVRAADAVTAVSIGTCEEIQARCPSLNHKLYEAIPIGGDPADFELLRKRPRANPYFDAEDGRCHICYIGTLLPLGFETLRAALKAAALVRLRRPELYERLRLHFFGTSNQTSPAAPQRVAPVAREIGVSDCVTEVAPRLNYLDALMAHTQASAILMMGSSERHYTASKLYPGLLAKRPILAIYHEASSVIGIVRRAARPPSARVVTYNDAERAESRVEAIYAEMVALIENPVYDPAAVEMSAVKEFSAETLAGKLAQTLERASLQQSDKL